MGPQSPTTPAPTTPTPAPTTHCHACCTNPTTVNSVSALANMLSVIDGRTVCVEKPYGSSWASSHYLNSQDGRTITVYAEWSDVDEDFSNLSCCDRFARPNCEEASFIAEWDRYCYDDPDLRCYDRKVNLSVYDLSQ